MNEPSLAFAGHSIRCVATFVPDLSIVRCAQATFSTISIKILVLTYRCISSLPDAVCNAVVSTEVSRGGHVPGTGHVPLAITGVEGYVAIFSRTFQLNQ